MQGRPENSLFPRGIDDPAVDNMYASFYLFSLPVGYFILNYLLLALLLT